MFYSAKKKILNRITSSNPTENLYPINSCVADPKNWIIGLHKSPIKREDPLTILSRHHAYSFLI